MIKKRKGTDRQQEKKNKLSDSEHNILHTLVVLKVNDTIAFCFPQTKVSNN